MVPDLAPTPGPAAAALASVLDAIKATTDSHQLDTLAQAVQGLAPTPTQAGAALAPVLDAIKATTNSYQLGTLAQAAQVLAGRLDGEVTGVLKKVAVAGLAAARTSTELSAWAGTLVAVPHSADANAALVTALKFPPTALADWKNEEQSATDRLLTAFRDRYPDAPREGDLDAMLPWMRQTFGADLVDRPLRNEDRPPPLKVVVGQIDLKALAGAQGD